MPTIKDIARECGVSYPTVSHVLNNTRPVSDATRQKVLDAIALLGYHPNAVARGLLKKKMNTLAVLFPHSRAAFVLNHHLGPLMDGIVSVAMSQGQTVMLSMASQFHESPQMLAQHCDGRADGMLVIGQPTNSPFVQALRQTSLPFVCINAAHEDADVPCVDVDQAATARDLTKYLLGQGHRRVAALLGDEAHLSNWQRLRGYREALGEFGLPVRDDLLLPGDYGEGSGHASAARLVDSLAPRERPTALLCMNDSIALGALRALGERGVRVPEQMSVAGIDDIAAAAAASPPLTTMRLPFRDLGEQAARMLLAQVDGQPVPWRRSVVPTQLIVRRSVAPPLPD